MNTQVLKSIIIGIILGAALFFIPFFILRLAIFFLIIGGLFRLFAWRRGGWWGHHRYAYYGNMADKIRGMSDEEYTAFRQRFDERCGHHYKNSENHKKETPNN